MTFDGSDCGLQIRRGLTPQRFNSSLSCGSRGAPLSVETLASACGRESGAAPRVSGSFWRRPTWAAAREIPRTPRQRVPAGNGNWAGRNAFYFFQKNIGKDALRMRCGACCSSASHFVLAKLCFQAPPLRRSDQHNGDHAQ